MESSCLNSYPKKRVKWVITPLPSFFLFQTTVHSLTEFSGLRFGSGLMSICSGGGGCGQRSETEHQEEMGSTGDAPLTVPPGLNEAMKLCG